MYLLGLKWPWVFLHSNISKGIHTCYIWFFNKITRYVCIWLILFLLFFFFPDFIDTYYNLTYKTLSMLYWAHYRMSDGRFRPKWIFKCDDDIFLDIFQFETYLHSFDKLKGSHLICSKREEAVPSRIDKNSTWLELYTYINQLINLSRNI